MFAALTNPKTVHTGQRLIKKDGVCKKKLLTFYLKIFFLSITVGKVFILRLSVIWFGKSMVNINL